MVKRFILAVLGLLVLVGLLGGIKLLQFKDMAAHGKQAAFPPAPVTTAPVTADQWETALTAVGSLSAVQGVTVTAELRGKVAAITFTPGARAAAGDLLVRQDTAVEESQLRSAEASLALAKVDYDRMARLLPQKVIARSDFDNADARLKQAKAEVDRIRTSIDQKNIRAPFAGRLGIRLVNLGQNLDEGTPIVTLQAMDPIYVDFRLPQQTLAQIRQGFAVRVGNDTLGGRTVNGTITAISPEVDPVTRNVTVQATVTNADERLRPGMFVQVAVILPEPDPVLRIPATAVLHAPYSDSVFVVVPAKDGNGQVLRQQIVRLGRSRGDYVAVNDGLKDGEIVVSTGVFKLRNGQAVREDNTLNPTFSLTPQPKNS